MDLSRVSSLHHLPVELLHTIFVWACTDGGMTGYSLSLVSSYIRAASHPVRYHSIELTGLRRITAFTTHYTHLCIAASATQPPPKVRHLLLTSHSAMRTRKVCASEHVADDIFERRGARPDTIATLLALLAPDLHTLALVSTYACATLFARCRAPFAALSDLTVARSNGLDTFAPGTAAASHPEAASGATRLWGDAGGPALFPKLRRLHFVMGVVDGCFGEMLGRWSALAPEVEVLRLSEVPPRGIAAGLCDVFAADRAVRAPIFPKLARVLVQPFSLPPPKRLKFDLAEQREQFVSGVEKMSCQARKGLQVILVPAGTKKKGQHSVDFVQGWLKGVEGEMGFWDATGG